MSLFPYYARDRIAALKKVGACPICFNAHQLFNCPKKDRMCSICGKPNHHDLVCLKTYYTTSNSYCDTGHVTAGTDADTLLHFMRVRGRKRHSYINVFFDSGSNGNFVTHDCAKKNNYPSEEFTVDVRTLGDRVETLNTVRYRWRDLRSQVFFEYSGNELSKVGIFYWLFFVTGKSFKISPKDI